MAWYWVLLLVVGVQAAFFFVYWLLTRSSQPSWAVEIGKLLNESGATRLSEELEAEKVERGRVEQEMRTLAAEYKLVAAWYTKHREKIDDDARKEFDILAGDHTALDAKLDKLLGSRADDTKPGIVVGEPIDDPTTPIE